MSIFRNTVWFIKGLKEYTRGGYQAASKNFNSQDLEVDVTGRSFVITGANSGLGKATALAIARKGGTVHLVCRNRERGEVAKTEIAESTGSQNVHLHQLDINKPRDIYKFVNTFESDGNTIDVLTPANLSSGAGWFESYLVKNPETGLLVTRLKQHGETDKVNNAGCMVNTRELTEDGLEKNFATNTLGTHILTTALIPLLMKSTRPRVIIVSSGGMLVQTLNINDLQVEKMKPFDGTMVYAQNKRQQVVMTEQYAKKYPSIQFSSMHPGWADTPAVRSSMPEFYEKMKNRLRTVEEGADTIVWLALSEAAIKQPSGLFFQDRTAVSTHLPLAWTKSTPQQNEQLMNELDRIAANFR